MSIEKVFNKLMGLKTCEKCERATKEIFLGDEQELCVECYLEWLDWVED